MEKDRNGMRSGTSSVNTSYYTEPGNYTSSKSLYSTRSARTAKSQSTYSERFFSRWKKPLVHSAFFTNLQKGSNIAGIYCVVMALFTMAHSIFDVYTLFMAEPGVAHYGYYLISFEFVYAGNQDVRRCLITFALFSCVLGFALLITSIMLLVGLRKEVESKFIGYLWVMGIFTLWRLFAFIFSSILNDLWFAYHAFMCAIWVILTVVNVFAWVVVYSLYHELRDITRLEDIAKLKMGTLSSLNASVSHHSISFSTGAGSIHSSRPTTPRHSVHTQPV